MAEGDAEALDRAFKEQTSRAVLVALMERLKPRMTDLATFQTIGANLGDGDEWQLKRPYYTIVGRAGDVDEIPVALLHQRGSFAVWTSPPRPRSRRERRTRGSRGWRASFIGAVTETAFCDQRWASADGTCVYSRRWLGVSFA